MTQFVNSPVSEIAIPTAGEVFLDGTFIELASSSDPVRPNLLRWQGNEQVVQSIVEHNGVRYKAPTVHESILRGLRLPTTVGSFCTERELLADISKLVHDFVALPEKYIALIGRIILATWVVEALETAPTILIDGPDFSRGSTLLQLLHCLCRRALPMSGVTPTAIYSLPSGMKFTLLLRQTAISAKLSNLLRAASRRDSPILRRGELRDFFGTQVLLCDAGVDCEFWPGSIRVPCLPNNSKLARLDSETQQHIVEKFQSELLAFRIASYAAARVTRFDALNFAIPLRDLAMSLAAATPTDPDLQAELLVLLQEENAEIRAASWVDLDTVIIESLLVYCREARMENVYVGAIAEMAEKILEKRGESRRVDPGKVGRRMKSLGLSTEPRDGQGIKLKFTNAVCMRVNDLAQQFDVPGVRDTNVGNVAYVP